MKRKTIIITLIFIFILSGLIFIHRNVLAINAETFDSIKNENLIRVGISTNNFGRFEYEEVSITSKGRFELIDKSTNSLIAKSEGNGIFTFKIADESISVYNSNNLTAKDIIGPISIKSLDNAPFQISGLKRKGKIALYRGEMEIVKSPTRKDKFSVVNILPLEDYLKGVVPNELPPSFGLEALKAQTVAARNYAVKPRVKQYNQFDICDSVECQVYFGYNTEDPLANQAIEETKGLMALYGGDLILALYSSTAGGYTENYENAFSEPGNTAFPSRSLPYLKGKPDISGMLSLNEELQARIFYTSYPECFDNKSGYFRWTRSWSRDEIEAVLNKNLKKYYSSAFIYPKLEKDSTIGILQKIEVVSRGVSGKAMIVKITTNKGEWHILKELVIRRVFENSGKILPSANVIFDNKFDQNGNLAQVEALGGGLGHGVGMSQYGAGYMSKTGYTFDKILQHYYDGISIGTKPVILKSQISASPVTQIFKSPDGKASLIVDNLEFVDNFKIMINSNEVNISKDDFVSGKINLNKYINKGTNEVIYYPPEGKKIKSLRAWIEVFEPLVQCQELENDQK